MKPSKLNQTAPGQIKMPGRKDAVAPVSKPAVVLKHKAGFKITNPILKVIISDIKRLLHIKEIDSGERWSDWKGQLR
jgi:hypothetical protein